MKGAYAMSKTNKIQEDVFDNIFDRGITADELAARKTSLARVLDQVQQAIAKVEADGSDATMLKKLQAKEEQLQELLDTADDYPIADAEESEGGTEDGADEADGDDSGATDGDDGEESTESDDEHRPGKSDAGSGSGGNGSGDDNPSDAESDGDDGTDGDSGDDDGSEGKGGKKSDGKKDKGDDGDSEEEDGDEGDSKDKGKKDAGDDGDDGDDDTKGKSKDSKKKKPGEDDSDDGLDGDDDGDDDGDSKSSKKSKSKEAGEDEDDSEDGDSPDEDPEEGDDSEGGGTDGDGDSPDKALIDPFKRMPPGTPGGGKMPKEIETVFDAAKRILGKLEGEARRGAVQGLKDLLVNKTGYYEENLDTRKLQEAVKKTIAQMSKDEFNDILASAMELADKVIKVSYSDDLPIRAKEIKRAASSRIDNLELEKEDADYIQADKHAMRAFDRENAKYRKVKPLSGLDTFKNTLYKAVKTQVEESDEEEDSWAALDRRHEDDPSIVKKGYIRDSSEEIPTVNVYFDQSGSWTNADIEIGKRAVSVINKFHEQGEINLQIFYMSAAGVTTTAAAARADGRAEGWYEALKHIKSSKAKNVVILSDSDLDHYEWCNRPTGDNGKTVVDGCVWWLWKNSSVSNKALKELRGRRGNFQYQFESYY